MNGVTEGREMNGRQPAKTMEIKDEMKENVERAEEEERRNDSPEIRRGDVR